MTRSRRRSRFSADICRAAFCYWCRWPRRSRRTRRPKTRSYRGRLRVAGVRHRRTAGWPPPWTTGRTWTSAAVVGSRRPANRLGRPWNRRTTGRSHPRPRPPLSARGACPATVFGRRPCTARGPPACGNTR